MKHIRLLAITAGLWAATHGVPTVAGPDAPEGWTAAVNALTVSLTQRVTPEVLRASFSERYASQTLDGKTAGIELLAPILSQVDWVHQLTYKTTPDTLAADMAAAVASSPLPDDVKNYLTPGGEQPERTANVTAMKWIAQHLHARADQPVAVILAHAPPVQADSDDANHGRVIVILVAGELVTREQYRFKQVAFGEFTPTK